MSGKSELVAKVSEAIFNDPQSPWAASDIDRMAEIAVDTLAAHKLRMIATVAELDALPEDSVILDDWWYPKIKGQNGKWWRPDCPRGIAAEGTVLPTRLLWTPEDGQLT